MQEELDAEQSSADGADDKSSDTDVGSEAGLEGAYLQQTMSVCFIVLRLAL